MTDQQHAHAALAGVVSARAITGTKVFDRHGTQLGIIHDIMLNAATEAVAFAIMSSGGRFSGVNQRYYPLPWHVLRAGTAQDGYVLDVTQQVLEAAPTCALSETGMWLDDSTSAAVNAYYAGA